MVKYFRGEAERLNHRKITIFIGLEWILSPGGQKVVTSHVVNWQDRILDWLTLLLFIPVRLFVTPWTAACLSVTISQSSTLAGVSHVQESLVFHIPAERAGRTNATNLHHPQVVCVCMCVIHVCMWWVCVGEMCVCGFVDLCVCVCGGMGVVVVPGQGIWSHTMDEEASMFFFFFTRAIQMTYRYFLKLFLFLAVLGLHCCGLSPVALRWGLLFVAVLRLLTAVSSLLQSTGSRHTGFGNCSTWAQKLWLLGSRAWAQ